MGGEIAITVLALFFSAIFSGYEIAFFASNKLRIELDRKQGRRYAVAMHRFTDHPDELISCLLMGNNVAIVIYGISIAKILDPLIGQYITHSLGGILAIETCIATLIVLITAEFLPKALSRLNPNGVFSSLYWVILFFYYLFYPLTFITGFISRGVLNIWFGKRLAGREPKDQPFNKSDLIHLSKDTEIESFRNALNFSKVKLKECMIPRSGIVAIAQEEEVSTLIGLFIESGFSRILVYRDNLDDMIGYVHSKDLFKDKNKPIGALLRKIQAVPEEMNAQSLLAHFTRNRISIAVVQNASGRTTGVVTLEDLMEEIFGDIHDELDKE